VLAVTFWCRFWVFLTVLFVFVFHRVLFSLIFIGDICHASPMFTSSFVNIICLCLAEDFFLSFHYQWEWLLVTNCELFQVNCISVIVALSVFSLLLLPSGSWRTFSLFFIPCFSVWLWVFQLYDRFCFSSYRVIIVSFPSMNRFAHHLSCNITETTFMSENMPNPVYVESFCSLS